MILLFALPGCVAPPGRGSITLEEQVGFRTSAIQVLKEAALCDEPALRMNAIEALGEVAPREGLPCIGLNIENGYAGVSFAAMMTLGSMGNADFIDRILTRAEHPDPNVRIAALYALHRLGDQRRTGELSDYMLNNRDARVRANAALAVGRLREPCSAKLLHRALKRERKDLPKMQITESLALLGDRHATEVLLYQGNSSYPDQATLALMLLGNATCHEAEDLFRDRLCRADFPEVKLAAARGLGRLGYEDGLDVAIGHLWYRSPRKGWDNDPAEQQIARTRGLAALALEAIGSPEALKSLKAAFESEDQPLYVRLTIARAAIRIIDKQKKLSAVSYQPSTGEPPAASQDLQTRGRPTTTGP